ncbi:MAG: recombinase family protein [Patescibacteria group bacterium]|nr:recombinase family protein [Patescibacteria group bacterium]
MDSPTTAFVYTRFATHDDGGPSHDEQEAACRQFAQGHYYYIQEVFADADVSDSLLHRPGLAQALAALTRGSVLLVASGDRLAGDLLVDLSIRREAADRGARIEHADGTTPDTTPEGRLIQNILAAFASYERDRKRGLTQGTRRLARSGAGPYPPAADPVPIGWTVDPSNPAALLPCEQERDAVERARELHRLDAGTPEEIALRITNEAGPCRGRPWTGRILRPFLSSPLPWN